MTKDGFSNGQDFVTCTKNLVSGGKQDFVTFSKDLDFVTFAKIVERYVHQNCGACKKNRIRYHYRHDCRIFDHQNPISSAENSAQYFLKDSRGRKVGRENTRRKNALS